MTSVNNIHNHEHKTCHTYLRKYLLLNHALTNWHITMIYLYCMTSFVIDWDLYGNINSHAYHSGIEMDKRNTAANNIYID